MDETRLIELETKIAHQEMAIERMQNALFEQSQIIASLEKSLKRLKDRCDEAGMGTAVPPNEKPPHY
jgi:SlyX protein